MALHVPKAGFQSMMKDGAKHFSGVEEAVLRNIAACKELSKVVRTSFGPNGMNKMIINRLDKLFVTNDAATIIKELEVEHPAAKMLVMASERQESEVGDATNLVLLFAGELLENADSLVRMGLSTAEIISGYDLAAKKALELLSGLACYTVENIRDKTQVAYALKTALASKQFGYENFLSELVAKACVDILPKKNTNFNVDNVRVVKILGSGVLASTVISGMVFKREVDTHISEVANAKVAIFSCPLDVSTTETKGTVLLNNADELLSFAQGEEAQLDKEVKEIAATGANVVVCGSKVGDMVMHFLNKYNLMVVRVPSKFDIRRLCQATGATAVARFGAPTKEELGSCSLVHTTEIGEERVVVFKQDGDESAISTVVVRGSTPNIMEDIERAVDDAVNVFKALTKNPQFVAGAGSTEIELARLLGTFADTRTGLEQYAIKKFAQSFEVVPRALADNAGVSSGELISRLYAAHQAGKTNVGFDLASEADFAPSGVTAAIGGAAAVAVADARELGVLDLLAAKATAIKFAAQAAVTVLRVDQIIMAKPAGGPKLPKDGQRDWDEDQEAPQME
ncbi:chaperonin containing TCP1 subunit 8 [Capsaspora owczarzaki ATCC 30864]|uniref:CCT-theta n=1 Tax=Capsaspora owczarzaki (strain ATCC 30864) TaxID=595528 RepID=A0A0D2WPW6_CAPO3|nr:chaperonin containing TCP1 subunit 8 [Capsaspora owczarzaki ATCC 30864]KJE93545.1 chaperonin containing TCP1 subunit 8 [Capsaspora owczarzaki ATCC 30864]|eukprot:XP_004348144.1 chaperonin containing TCP1 subunit 8 [Capsaspora owczarzaki ATCC 30864]